MPKQYYTIRSFAKGMNTRRDPRDIAEDEAQFIENMSIDSLGKIKSAGSLYGHNVNHIGSGTTGVGDGKYIAVRGGENADVAVINGSGGYNLFYFESDHSALSENFITTTDGTATLNIGSDDGEISFGNPSTLANSGVGEAGAPEEGSPR